MSNESEIDDLRKERKELREEKKRYKDMADSLDKILDKLKSSKSFLDEGISIFKENYISNSESYKRNEIDIDTNYNIVCNIYDNINDEILPSCNKKIKSLEEKIEDLTDEIDDLKESNE